MNFFKSILSDDQDPPEPEPHPNSALKPRRDEGSPRDDDDGWSFGGLIKNFAMQSESVIEIYRRDLKEFGTGLRKETEILRESASRAVKDLPASLEAAHGVLKSTASIISREFSSDGESETPGTNRSVNSGRYVWFEAQLSAIQSDLNTFCEEPEDVEDYGKWKLGFELENYSDETGGLIGENGILDGVHKRLVPNAVDRETFWCRYFYRVDKLKQQEIVRANLVKRAISADDEEELSWEVDDDEEEDGNGSDRPGGVNVRGRDGKGDDVVCDGNLNSVENGAAGDNMEGGSVNVSESEKSNLVESVKESSADVSLGEKEEKRETVAEVKRDEKVKSEDESVKDSNDEKVDVEEKGDSGKKGDASVVSSHQPKAVEEEDLGWDEIEDTGSGDEKKISATTRGGSPKKEDLPKQLSAAGDDDVDDLSWDIEDDEEPVKA